MKTTCFPPRKNSRRGSILMMTLVVTACVGLVLMTYLKMIRSQNSFTYRSQAWNACLPIAEAGVEEAMSHLNSTITTNLAADGWVASGTTYAKTRTLGDSFAEVSIYASNNTAPVIISKGSVPAPLTLASSSGAFLAAAGGGTPTYITRTVKVTTFKDPLFIKALAVKNTVNMNGNKITVDSYNSNVAAYNALTAGDKGDVSTDGDLIDTVSVGNANIKGHVQVGPKGKVMIGPNGVVGSVVWHLAGKLGIEPGWVRKDMNVKYPDVNPPWTGGAITPSGNGSWKYRLGDDKYELSSMTLGPGDKVQVLGKAVLWVKGDMTIHDVFEVLPGCWVKIFVSGNINLTDAIYNIKSDIPSDFMIYGLPTCKQIEIKSGFAAVIYAPQATMTVSGGSHFYGAAVAENIILNGNTGFHYDEALADLDDFRGYIITSWTEL